MLACLPPRSSGRAVITFRVAPMPPVGVSAREDLYTWICEMPSDAMFAKSKARPFRSPRFEVGIWRPLSSTMLKSGPTPRTVIFEPSPIERSIDTPLMRCSDSARLVSGNLPMSSATMPSTMPSALRLRFSDEAMLWRRPLTTTVCVTVASSAAAGAGFAPAAAPLAGTASGAVLCWAAAWAMNAVQAAATARLMIVCFAKG